MNRRTDILRRDGRLDVASRRVYTGILARTLLRVALVIALLALSGRAAPLQIRAQQNQAPQRPPVFRGESVLVTVDAYPQRNGRIVEGLTASDFQILEDGKPQTVENIEFVRIEPSLSESLRQDPGSMNEMYALVANPHVRVFVVLLDQLHVTIAGAHASRQPLVNTLNSLIGADDLFAVMTQNIDPRALTFGRRLQSIADHLAQYWDWGERYRFGLDVADPWEQKLKDCFEFKPTGQHPPWMVSDNGQGRYLYELLIDRRREDRTLTAIEHLIDRMAGLRESRTVALIITEGWRLFPNDPRLAEESKEYGSYLPAVGISGGQIVIGDRNGVTAQGAAKICNDELIRLATLDDGRRLQDITKRANGANVSFYPVNPSGLQTADTPIGVANQPSQLEDSTRLRNRLDGMRVLADNTDGIASVNTNDIGAGMKRIVDDVSAYYLLGYYSTNTAHDGHYRRIDVRLKTPDVNVRARRGYFAPTDKPAKSPLAATAPAPERPEGLDEALKELSATQPDSDLFLRGAIAGDRLQLALEISSARSMVLPWSSGADVRVVATGPDGIALPPATARLEASTRAVMMSVPIAGTPAVMRVAAKVSARGEFLEGAADIQPGPAGVVGAAMLYRGRPAATSPLQPVADSTYSRIERVHVEWPVTGDIDQRSARLLNRSGQALTVPVSVTERNTDGRHVVAADLNLAPLGAGQYVIELTVGRGATTERRFVAFRVVQ
ncbi:MAG TPA: VWA domain-containing protein [Vicinamibacterales bacterium]|nr:VWA domain-containing protein [Vicinamibacterales bacterium]